MNQEPQNWSIKANLIHLLNQANSINQKNPIDTSINLNNYKYKSTKNDLDGTLCKNRK